MLYDCHSHIDLINENEVKPLLEDSLKEGVGEIISCATSFYSNEKTLTLSKQHPQIKPALGLYPLNALELNEEELNKAINYIKKNISKAIAIGEVGLDFKYATKEEEQEKQKKVFSEFIELSKEFNKPLIIHSRYAQREVIELLKEKKAEKVLLHSFTESKKLMKQATELGYYVSCGLKTLTDEIIQKNLKPFPLEQLLFETDSPIIFDNEKAHPKKIKLIAEKVAELKEIDFKEVEKQQEKNYSTLF
ncbi:MAG: TatD family hydrolase [Candidatus Iainarchaeum sp.]|jgi:TatD DNase family protein